MKAGYVCLLFLLLVTIYGCTKSDVPAVTDSNTLDTFISKQYRYDAVELYLREIYGDSTHKNYNDPILDSTQLDKILRIIQAVYQSSSPQRDTVFLIRKLRARNRVASWWLGLSVNPAAPEIKKLAANILTTGQPALDNILTTYGFDTVDASLYSSGFLYVGASRLYNLKPIMKQFEKIPSIDFAFTGGAVGDGSDILLTRNNDSARIRFSYGAGDCPSGCTYRRTWEFAVANNKASFVSVR